ncbi:YopX family protein [Bacillus velezensis]|uniref:YopX family protein n=1 Tax=Bacillus velezensis TaxID=492670 RepID=UPI001C0C302E|nr:YopX family protein [Bacillus velezensis]QWQ47355.1 YopX family protein [Bacillus velezensis]
MNKACRVWDGEQMCYCGDEGICLSIGELGSIEGKVFGWSVWLGGYGVIAHSGDGKSVLMNGTDQFQTHSRLKRIYAGDIVKQEETATGGLFGPEPFIGEVKMIDGSWCIVNEKKEECRPLFSETATNKVIGDIYQDPELLEGAE